MKALLPLLLAAAAAAQQYDIVIKGGRVLDPANNVDGLRDVAITGNRIARVAPDIPASQAKKVVDAKDRVVAPGLIDLHFHAFGYSGAIFPDDTALPTGTTTVVDAGGAGFRTIDNFRKDIISTAKTRVLVLMNIAGKGMIGSSSEDNVEDMRPQETAEAIRKNRDVVVGIKVAHFGKPGWDALKRAVEAGRLAEVPVMVDDKIFTNSGRTSREKLLDVMRPGDMHTHMYNDRQVEIVSRFNGKVQEYARQARIRGVLFDLGHGGGSFLWTVAAAAAKDGFFPDTISTDLHDSSIMMQQSDMPNCMTKMLYLGMPFEETVKRSTMEPARVIKRLPEIGTLGEGRAADIAILAVRDGIFALKDSWGKKALAKKKIENVLTIRNGQIVWDSEGRAYPEWTTAGEYEVIR